MAKKRILIVDDEEKFTQMVKINLDETGNYEIKTENRAVRALAAAKAFRPDLILMDVIMPDLSGDIVASRIEEDPELKNTPIVFVTATIRKVEAASRGGVIGGHLFLSKPISIEELIDCIEENARVPAEPDSPERAAIVSFNPFRWFRRFWKIKLNTESDS